MLQVVFQLRQHRCPATYAIEQILKACARIWVAVFDQVHKGPLFSRFDIDLNRSEVAPAVGFPLENIAFRALPLQHLAGKIAGVTVQPVVFEAQEQATAWTRFQLCSLCKPLIQPVCSGKGIENSLR